MAENDETLDLDDSDLPPLTDSTRIARRGAASAPAAKPRAVIRIVRCPDARLVDATFALRTDDVRIGRTEGLNTFTINDPDVSRTHLMLAWRGSGYVLSDLQSTNGTVVNGGLVTGEMTLTAGDTIQLGGATVLRYDRA